MIDFKKDPVYKVTSEPQIINVPKMRFVMVDGSGAPENNPQFQNSMAILYGVVYTLKFWDKKHAAPTGYAKFSLAPLEGLWWQKGTTGFDSNKPGTWLWTVMIRVPDFVSPALFKQVVDELIDKKQSDIYKQGRLEWFTEGTCVQMMHTGPYNQEGSDIKKLHRFAKESGYSLAGKHHELYFGDPRRTAPEKLRTILRQPVKIKR